MNNKSEICFKLNQANNRTTRSEFIIAYKHDIVQNINFLTKLVAHNFLINILQEIHIFGVII